MDSTVSGRYFLVSKPANGIPDFSALLTAEMSKEISAREYEVADGVVVRVEYCVSDGDFVVGQFCRKQMANIPPQAGPKGLSKMVLPDGQGIGHLAAFRYHEPTRVILLQNNMTCVTTNRIGLYLAKLNTAALHVFQPIMREDALDRFANRKVRSFTVRFASPKNLEALDRDGVSSAKGGETDGRSVSRDGYDDKCWCRAS